MCRFCRRRAVHPPRVGKRTTRAQKEQCCVTCWQTSSFWATVEKSARLARGERARRPGIEARLAWLSKTGPVTEAALVRWRQNALETSAAEGGDS